jgi:hypothetical protein
VAANAGESQLGIGAARELPEILQPGEYSRLAAAGQERIALRRGALEPNLVGATEKRGRQHGIEAQAHASQALFAQIPLVNQGILGFRQGMPMPAIQITNLLTELSGIEP